MIKTWMVLGIAGATLSLPLLLVASPPPKVKKAVNSAKGSADVDVDINIPDDASSAADQNADQNGANEEKVAVPMSDVKFGLAIFAMFMFYWSYAGAEHCPGDWLVRCASLSSS
jgi:hypothetical protein